MKRNICLCFVSFFALSQTFAQPSVEEVFESCSSELEDQARLACFDQYSLLYEEALTEMPAVEIFSPRLGLLGRLTSDDPNFFSYSHPVSDPARGEDHHLGFNLSVKYPLFDSSEPGPFNSKAGQGKLRWADRLFLIYNGEYDFYAVSNSDTYKSSPVISRNQNPGIAFEWDLSMDKTHRLRVGAFHQSNGQTFEEDDFRINPDGTIIDARTLLEADILATNEDYALGQISRSWNYGYVRYQYNNHPDQPYAAGLKHFQVDLRTYDVEQDNIWWEQGNRSRIEDYDGLRMLYEQSVSIPVPYSGYDLSAIAGVKLKTGTSELDALSNFTYQASLGFRLNNWFISGFYFDGFGKEPATYHLRNRYWGIGIEAR